MTSAMAIQRVIYGAALAESLSAPSTYHRRHLVRENLSKKIRDHLEFADNNYQTNIISAFSLPRGSSVLAPRASDDLEWLTFSAIAAISGDIAGAWKNLAHTDEKIWARAGTQIALRNIRTGNFKYSGHDNPLYFDDISGIRAIGIALVFKDSALSAEGGIETDSGITHYSDGVWFAQVIGKLCWLLLNGENKSTAIEESLRLVPTDSWTSNLVQVALASTAGISNVFERVLILDSKIIDRTPSHSNIAPETLACLISHALNATTAEQFLASAFLHDRMSDSLPALHGALASLLFKQEWLPHGFLEQDLRLAGCSLPHLADFSLLDLADQIAGFKTI
jgi:hypothetical protein